MFTLLYLHGFLSSPLSHKAQYTQKWLAQHRPDTTYICPTLSSYPSEAIKQLNHTVKTLNKPLYIIGSSLGGFWATYLIEQGLAQKAALINPAVAPHTRFKEFVGKTLETYSGEKKLYTPTQKDLQDLVALDTLNITQPQRYWLMVQTGDETLNYRDAVEKYHASKQLIEPGGNHAFNTYETWLPEIIQFFETAQ